MNTYPNIRARYSKGVLKLAKRPKLAEGTEVWVSVKPLMTKRARKKPIHQRRYSSPTRTIPASALNNLVGIISVGGDALADSEALYDGS